MDKINILIIKPSSLGDVINAFPAAVLVASAFPQANIDWVINDNLKSVLKYLPPVRKTIEFERKKLGQPFSFLPSFFSLYRELRAEKYDFVIDLQGLMRSALIARLAKAKTRIGFKDTREKIAGSLYHKKVMVPGKYKHAVEKNLYLVAKGLDIDYEYVDFEFPEHEESSLIVEEIFSARGIDEQDICIGIVPGARWATKRWPSLFFIKVIEQIIEFNYKVKFVLIGDPSDRDDADYIVSKTPKKNVVNCVGESNLTELVEIIRRCNYVITNDSGPMHIAAALNVPTVALFGPTDPERCGPYCDDGVVFQPELNCIKCYKRECNKKNNCHMSVSSKDVADHVIERLKEVI